MISTSELRVGALYINDLMDNRSWVPWYEHAGLEYQTIYMSRKDILMYLGAVLEHSRSVIAHIFLLGEKKYYVYNPNFIYGLQKVE